MYKRYQMNIAPEDFLSELDKKKVTSK